jgi:hypothetical protein
VYEAIIYDMLARTRGYGQDTRQTQNNSRISSKG